MPFKQNPTQDTFSQQPVVLTRDWASRQGDVAGNKDENFLNCMFEVAKEKDLNDKRTFIIKRAGSSTYYTPSASGFVRGLFFWNDNHKIVYTVGDTIYFYDINTAAVTTFAAAFGTTTGKVGYTTFLYDTGAVSLIATDGTTLVSISTAGVLTTCADADLPSPHLPYPVFLDGYLCLAKKDTASIYNSDLNDPMLWTAGNVIDAEMDGDRITALAKVNNYILAFGSSTIEYFWDAGVATGSPFQRNPTPVKINQFIGGLSSYGNTLYFMGTNDNGQLDVFRLQDFILEPIGNPTTTRFLNGQTTAFTDYVGTIVTNLGHTFYLLNRITHTLAYDLETKMWTRWAHQGNTNFNITNATLITLQNKVYTLFTIGTASPLYIFDDSVYRDSGVNFTVRIVSETIDFGTLNRKTMGRLIIHCDRPSSNSLMSVSWSDNDYQTYNTPITVNLNQDSPSLYRLGSFRQRCFKLEYTDNFPLRITKLVADINKGTT